MEQGKYLLAKEFDQHEASLKKEEARRQVESVKQKHDRDRKKLVDAHEQQVEEFRDCEYINRASMHMQRVAHLCLHLLLLSLGRLHERL